MNFKSGIGKLFPAKKNNRTGFKIRSIRISIKVPVPKKIGAQYWGDYHFALGLKRALEKQVDVVRIDLMPNWETPMGLTDDVVIVLRGLSRYVPKPYHMNIMWNISHPDKITAEEYEAYDHVFVASQSYAEELKTEIKTPVTALLQCTDPALFYPDAMGGGDVPEHEVLFVGNSRKHYRKIVRDAIVGDLPLSVYGTLWHGLIPEKYIKGVYVKNEGLRCFYSRCKILLNDHWPSMRDKGFISNRIFDAGACGACIVSDRVQGMDKLFGVTVTAYQDADELKSVVTNLFSNDIKRRDLGEKLREIVQRNHTFEKRTSQILNVVETIAKQKRAISAYRESI